ncbi:SgrR family transcriptional regulator [Vibrio nigripulchritudo]|uniref:SgrR family transcriptional regulator n=1 Tax=Vibrio nigripulchritudo TaxID=28173 RepID=UPI002490686E|nr:SgrR family transcriptional regulator [Vibrio nigripulchritudo]
MLNKSSSSFINQIHLQRLKQLCALYPIKTPCSVDVQTLAQQLVCSDRNVAKLVKTLASLGWLTWQPGRGRGNKSTLEIQISFDSALLGMLEMHCRKGQLTEASRYAEQFGYSSTFRKHLPQWLYDAQEALIEKNHLVMLVPYTLPELHPLHAIRPVSRPHIEGLFDTLVRYDKESDRVMPNLAHHFEFRGNELWLRLRPDVHFHNGEKLSPDHVVQCVQALMERPHPKQILYRHVQSVHSQGGWVVVKMTFAYPMILRMLADTHASIYLEPDGSPFPIGTGPLQLDVDPHIHEAEQSAASEQAEGPKYSPCYPNTHWYLVRNPNYFGVGALIDTIEFWTIQTASDAVDAHIVHHGYSRTVPAASVNEQLSMGCEVMEFLYKDDILPIDERAWLVHHARDYCLQHDSAQTPVANCVSGLHQNKGMYLYSHTRTKPHRPVRVWCADLERSHYLSLIAHWRECGLEIDMLSHEDSDFADVAIGIYAAQDDYALNYYKWILCSDAFDACLSPEQQATLVGIVDQLLRSVSEVREFTDQLHRCEDWLIQQGVFAPLWRCSTAYNISDSIQGTETDSMGLMSLKKLWFDEHA